MILDIETYEEDTEKPKALIHTSGPCIALDSAR